MPLVACPNLYSSILNPSLLFCKVKDQKKARVDEGELCKDRKKTLSRQFPGAFAMVACNNGVSGDVESFSKLSSHHILEVLGATQPSKFIEPSVTEKQSNPTTCVPMIVAVAEFKGPEVHGVVRFAQASSGEQACSIEAVIDGLAPGLHGWSVHEFGDLTNGPFSTGPVYSLLTPIDRSDSQDQQGVGAGNLGSLIVDNKKHVEKTATNDWLVVADIIGRSVVLYGVSSGAGGQVQTRVAAAVIARSARPSSINPQLCNCDGSLLWQAKSC